MDQAVLYAVRHGQTTLNASNCFRGTANPPLDETGRGDAHELAEFLEPRQLGYVYASDKLRTRQTYEILHIHGICSCDAQFLPDLRALNVGNFSGKPKNRENTEQMEWYADNPDEVIPGGESINQFRARVQPLFLAGLQIFDKTGVPPLFVVHSSLVHELGNFFNHDHHSSRVEPGGAAAVFVRNGELRAEPIFKPKKAGENKADTIS